ncbi:polyketide synthase [Paenibacillus larvae]|nr:polyketide synthase [Paenibacillus larvae]MDT2285135.1 polyketide synthase [Paenibacillus larvae]
MPHGCSRGVTIYPEPIAGYVFQDGMIFSPDGHCRAFDEKAQGTVPGEGVGVVVLKRLQAAIEDGDYIHAVIKGVATNNDGYRKVGFTAPSIEGQTEVIQAAHRMAEVEAESIAYVEAHGTATTLGDPVELEALRRAFHSEHTGFCAIGSVKTNIGHLDAAAGVAGFIKTVLALKHREIPASLHFHNPTPKFDFSNSPFYVNSSTSEWKHDKYPMRAGVSSFGIGGTNAHIVLEEAVHALSAGKMNYA